MDTTFSTNTSLDTFSTPFATTTLAENEEERLNKLYSYSILDTPAESAFDKIAQLAAQIFDTDSAFVSFVDQDRVWFKSNLSYKTLPEVLRQDSFCSIAILQDEPTVISDTHEHQDLLNIFVVKEAGIRFYAGAPLITEEGYKLGTVCVTDTQTKKATKKQLDMLKSLASILMDELELRAVLRKSLHAQSDLMQLTVHDLKSPVCAIKALADEIHHSVDDTENILQMATLISEASSELIHGLNEVLQIAQIENGEIPIHRQTIRLNEVVQNLIKDFDILAKQKNMTIAFDPEGDYLIRADKGRLKEVFANLLSNCIKFSHAGSNIHLSIAKINDKIQIRFCDQGEGLSESDMSNLFTKFAKLSAKPTGNESSTGLGLSIVKMLVDLQNGKVWAESEGKKKGSTFIVEFHEATF